MKGLRRSLALMQSRGPKRWRPGRGEHHDVGRRRPRPRNERPLLEAIDRIPKVTWGANRGRRFQEGLLATRSVPDPPTGWVASMLFFHTLPSLSERAKLFFPFLDFFSLPSSKTSRLAFMANSAHSSSSFDGRASNISAAIELASSTWVKRVKSERAPGRLRASINSCSTWAVRRVRAKVSGSIPT